MSAPSKAPLRVLGVVPARGGSKGIPNKNLHPVRGRPLLAYTLDEALLARSLTACVVSTDSPEIAEAARAFGAEVPFLRPPELATDTALSLPVVQHAVEEMERVHAPFDVVVMLQPTAPLRSAQDIDGAIDLLLRTGADSVVSVVDVEGHHPLRMKRIAGDGILLNYVDQGHEDMRPRQALPPVYIRNGAIYATRRAVIVESDSLVGEDCRAFVMPIERSVNIDHAFDLLKLEYLLDLKS